MTTDLDTMLAMLARAKLDFERRVMEAENTPGVNDTVIREMGFTVLTVERGYLGFVTKIIFDGDGALVSIEGHE